VALPFIVGAVLSGVLSVAVTPLSAHRPAFIFYALPVMLPYTLVCLLNTEWIVVIFGLMALLLLGVNLFYSKTIHAALFDAVRLKFENLGLMEKLQQESAAAHLARIEAEAARDAAQMANAAKSKFLAAASHDLRQLVHAMSLFLEAMTRSGLSPQQQEINRNAQMASQVTRDMLNSLLDFSKVDAGVIKSAPRDFHLQPLFVQLEKEFSNLTDEKNLVYRKSETALAVFADPVLAAQILRNLISNALRYTEKGGIFIGCRLRKNGGAKLVVVEVWDTGIGIPAEQRGKIFGEFYQLGNPERDRQKGLGLGLAIVKGIAKTMGVEVTLASAPGKGSVFRLHLPLAQNAITDNLPGEPELVADLGGMHVLVVDDDRMVLDAMRTLLSGWHCSVVVAESIEEAMSGLGERVPDLVISDYRLREGVTGHDVIAALREKIKTDLPCIIITGDTAPDRLREAVAMDAVLLHKPVTPNELFSAMAGLL